MNIIKKLFYKTESIPLTVTSDNGFHLRPVARFVSKAKTYKCEITATFKNKTVSAKAVNTLLSLGLNKGDTFILVFQGKETKAASVLLKETFLTLMQEDVQIKEHKKSTHDYSSHRYEGESIYPGIAIANLYRYKEKEHYVQSNATFKGAVVKAVEQLTNLHNENSENDTSDIYLAQKELLLELSSKVRDIEGFVLLVDDEIKSLQGSKLESKSIDYQDILRLIKSNLGYSYHVSFPLEPFILLADDLLPSDINKLEKSAVQGVLLKKSALTSHTAILLRASGTPSLLLPEDIAVDDTKVILDTYSSVLLTHPSKHDIKSAKERKVLKEKESSSHYSKRFEPACSTKQIPIHVCANVTDFHSAKEAKEEGAEGIGLLRTEFLFTEQKPSLETQIKTYKDIFNIFDDVTIRTLDVGGDKVLPYIKLPKESNPFLGIRGVRLFKTHPKIMSEQLHAIFLASINKNVKIMFPMISTVEEFIEAKSFAHNVAKLHNLHIDNIHFGMMIEVPSVLFALSEFNKVVDFYSVGTNDLTQYLFATERTHPTLQTDIFSPIVFRALETIINSVMKPVSICGELASNTEAIPRLINMGYKTLSVTAKSIPQTKETIRHV